jgi:multiple sugar transport system ATP-binding protein
MASLTIANVRKRYGALEILKGIDLSIADGEFLILVGPSGCGKSTLLNMIAGLDTISDGEIRIGARCVNDVSPKDRDIAMVFQSYALYPSMTVRENIEFAMKMKKIPKADRDGTIERVSRMLQIDCSTGAPRSSPAGSASAWRWAAHSPAIRRCSCSTSRCRISTPSCASRCARRSRRCTSVCAPPSST